jgi:hypothetical protein
MPKTWEPKLLQSQAANDRADLETILQDLEHVMGCCELLLHRGTHPLTDLEAKALIDSVVIRYRRCFTGGQRARLDPKTLPSLRGALIARHDFFWNLANKHIAHSVNGFELNASVIHVAEDGNGQLLRGGLGSRGSATLELSLDDIHQFCDLVQDLVTDVTAHHISLSKEVELDVEAMSDEEVRALPEGYPPCEAKIDVSRHRQWPKRAARHHRKMDVI